MNARPRRVKFLVGLVLVAAIFLTAGTAELMRQTGTYVPSGLETIGFTSRASEPTDVQVRNMVDEVVTQVLGPQGFAALVKPGDKVVIKTNIVSPSSGASGDQGRSSITDPRIVQYVAEKIRTILGDSPASDIKVIDATFGFSSDPSETGNNHSFYWSRLERTGNNSVDSGDVCYDFDRDGYLDGTSNAQLVNVDAVSDRFTTMITEPSLGTVSVTLPKFLRTKAQAIAAGEPSKYCDVFIGLPILKSHHMAGLSGAIKLHYGLRDWSRFEHSGTTAGEHADFGKVYNGHFLDEYLIAMHRARSYDFILMDCITGNRAGPDVPNRDVAYYPADYIFMNAMLAGRNAIAMDTVGALFAGYKIDSVEFLERGRLDGLGTNDLAYLRVNGLSAFGTHRKALWTQYQPQNRYPFRDGWGSARVMTDFVDGPTTLTFTAPQKVGTRTYRFNWTAQKTGGADLNLVRLEFLVDGKVAAYRNTSLAGLSSGQMTVTLGESTEGKHTVQLAAWDNALNCKISSARTLTLGATNAQNEWSEYR